MEQTSIPARRADQIFRTGTETLIAETPTIVAGRVADYSRQTAEPTQPAAPHSIPLRWVVNAEVREPQTLKGRAVTGSRRFSRQEQSMLLPEDQTAYYWEGVYGELQPDGRAVLFIGGGTQKPILRVVPSGGEQDLVALVKDIVKIQALKRPEERMLGWLEYLRQPASDEGLRAALRSMVKASIEWAKLAPELERLLTDSRRGGDVRAYAFGIVAFGVVEEKWGGNRRQAVDFLCRIFSAEQDTNQSMQYMQYLKLILNYSNEESLRNARQPLRRQLLDCLKRREAEGNLAAQLENQFRQVWATHHPR